MGSHPAAGRRNGTRVLRKSKTLKVPQVHVGLPDNKTENMNARGMRIIVLLKVCLKPMGIALANELAMRPSDEGHK